MAGVLALAPERPAQTPEWSVEGVFLRHFEFSLERKLTEREIEGRSAKPWKDVYLEVDYSDAGAATFR